MTFVEFEKLVHKKYPEAYVCKHGEFHGSKINVAISFNGPEGKIYQYEGSYCNVLNKIGIKAIYKHHHDEMLKQLKIMKIVQGKTDEIFGFEIDYSKDIEELEKKLIDIEFNYVIV